MTKTFNELFNEIPGTKAAKTRIANAVANALNYTSPGGSWDSLAAMDRASVKRIRGAGPLARRAVVAALIKRGLPFKGWDWGLHHKRDPLTCKGCIRRNLLLAKMKADVALQKHDGQELRTAKNKITDLLMEVSFLRNELARIGVVAPPRVEIIKSMEAA